MPNLTSATGYVHDIAHGEMNMPQALMRFARAFGACVEMRDDPMDKEIPEEFAVSKYETEYYNRAKKALEDWQLLSTEDRLKVLQENRDRTIKQEEDDNKERVRGNQFLEGLIAEVKTWNPPSVDHAPLKSFALEQLTQSLSTDAYHYAERDPVTEYDIADRTESLQSSLQRAAESLAKAKQRAEERTSWVKALRESLKESV